MPQNLIARGFVNALLVVIYIFGVVNLMNYLANFEDNESLMPVMFLTLFVTSAAITGSLVLGKPVLLYLNGQKKEAVTLLTYTLVSMVALFILLFVIVVFAN